MYVEKGTLVVHKAELKGFRNTKLSYSQKQWVVVDIFSSKNEIQIRRIGLGFTMTISFEEFKNRFEAPDGRRVIL